MASTLPPEITTVAEAFAFFNALAATRSDRIDALEAEVTPQPDPLTITGTPPTTGTAGQPYSFTPSAAGGAGIKVYALASGTLLAGLSLNTSTGAITGTPSAAGTMANLSVHVTDDTGSAATTPTTVTIAAASPGTAWAFDDTSITFDRADVYFDGTTGNTPTPQPAIVSVTGPSTIVEGTGSTTPTSVAVSGPATIVEGTLQSASVAVTGPASIVEGN